MAERLILKILIAFFALILTMSSYAMVLPSSCETAIKRAFNARATWVMERTLPGSVKSLVSTGIVSFVVRKGICWQVCHPFCESITMSTNEMIFADEDSRRVKPLSQLPHYAELQKACDSFYYGDTKAFDDVFDASVAFSSNGLWTVTLSPSVRAMRRLIKSVELSGRDTIEKALIYTGDGGKSLIKFQEITSNISSN